MVPIHRRIRRPGVPGLSVWIIGAIILLSFPQSVWGAPPSDTNRAVLQEGLGQAIVNAARAGSIAEKSQAQEVLGTLIAQAALAGIEGKAAIRPAVAHPGSPRGMETRGEPGAWIFAALGGTLMLLISFFAIRSGPIPRHP